MDLPNPYVGGRAPQRSLLRRCLKCVGTGLCLPVFCFVGCLSCTGNSLAGKRGRKRQVKAVLSILGLLFVYQLLAETNLSHDKVATMIDFWNAKSAQYDQPLVEHCTPDQEYNEPSTAVAILGLGVMASQLKCEAAVESLGKIGGWTGRVYLFTDKEDCYDVEKMKKLGGNDLRIVGISGDYSGAFAMPSLSGTKGNRLRAKLLKSRLFKEIDDPAVEQLLYMDCDEVLAQTGCAKPMMEEMFGGWSDSENIRFRITRTSEQIGGPDMAHHFDEAIQAQFDNPFFMIHAGFFAAKRDKSWKALEEWEKELSTMKYAADRMAFVTAMRNVQAASKANHTENHMQIGSWKTGWEKFADARSPHLPCVVHVSHKRCLWQGRKNVQSIIDRLGLETYKQEDGTTLNYCESLLTYPFTLGWVPYKSCRKIETWV